MQLTGFVMHKIQLVIAACLLFFGGSAFAVEYDCVVEKKVSMEMDYSEQYIAQSDFRVKISERYEGATLSRCSFSRIEQKFTCDEYRVDRVVYDERVKIKKFYVFGSQFDVQLFPNMIFVENNGRGDVAYGRCSVVAP